MSKKKPTLSEIRAKAGRAGGLVKSRAKTKAVRINGQNGGRPRKSSVKGRRQAG